MGDLHQSKGWGIYPQEGAMSHVVPMNDLMGHTCDEMRCWCSPKVKEGVIVHNSADLREETE